MCIDENISHSADIFEGKAYSICVDDEEKITSEYVKALLTANGTDVEFLLSAMRNTIYSKIIRLVYFEEISFDEAAKIIGITSNEIYYKHSLAVKQLIKTWRILNE